MWDLWRSWSNVFAYTDCCEGKRSTSHLLFKHITLWAKVELLWFQQPRPLHSIVFLYMVKMQEITMRKLWITSGRYLYTLIFGKSLNYCDNFMSLWRLTSRIWLYKLYGKLTIKRPVLIYNYYTNYFNSKDEYMVTFLLKTVSWFIRLTIKLFKHFEFQWSLSEETCIATWDANNNDWLLEVITECKHIKWILCVYMYVHLKMGLI